MRIGLVARGDTGGLAMQTHDFYVHMKPSRVLLVDYDVYTGYYTYYDRYVGDVVKTDREPSAEVLSEFLQDIDIVFTVETPYNHELYTIARQRGIKSVCQYNFEFLQHHQEPYLPRPDLLLAPSSWNIDGLEKLGVPVKYLHVPIDRAKFPFKLRKQARKFLHIAGHKTIADRNGTALLMDSFSMIQSQIELIIRSQDELPRNTTDHRLTIELGDPKDHADIYKDEDVLILPRRYGGLSLQLNEAMSLGMVPIMLDVEPQNEFLDNKCLIPAQIKEWIDVKTKLPVYGCTPQQLADKIDELANMDLSNLSHKSDKYASERDWRVMKPKYEELFKWILR